MSAGQSGQKEDSMKPYPHTDRDWKLIKDVVEQEGVSSCLRLVKAYREEVEALAAKPALTDAELADELDAARERFGYLTNDQAVKAIDALRARGAK